MKKEKEVELTDEQFARLLAMLKAADKNKKIVSSLERDEIVVSADVEKKIHIDNTTVDLTTLSFCGAYTDGLVSTEAGAGGFGNNERVFLNYPGAEPTEIPASTIRLRYRSCP